MNNINRTRASVHRHADNKKQTTKKHADSSKSRTKTDEQAVQDISACFNELAVQDISACLNEFKCDPYFTMELAAIP